MSGKSDYKRYSKVGPGGRRCICCYPGPGPFRRLMERIFKKRGREAERKFELTEIKDVIR